MGFFSSLFGGASSQQKDVIDRSNAEAGAAQTTGNALQDQFRNQYGWQDATRQNYQNQADQAYGDLANQPGYTPEQATSIYGDPNAGFKYYNPSELQGDVSGYQGALTGAANEGKQILQAAPTNEMQWQGGINNQLEQSGNEAVGGLESGLGSAVKGYGQGLGSAVSGSGQGLGASVDEYGNQLDAAVDPSKLTVGDQLNGYQMTPEEQQNIRNVAAQTTEGQYQKMQQEADRIANAQGNTSPAALAAIKENLGRQGAIDAGNAASSAELGANQAAANRQLAATQTNIGANQALAGFQAQNAGNLYGARSNAASNLYGAQSGAATNLYGAQSGAANNLYGAKSGTAQNLANVEQSGVQNITGNQANAAAQQAALGYNAAQTGGAQKIATDTGLQQTGQNLATGADTAASNRSTGIANQAITGQNAYRGYLTNQQQNATQAQETAGQQQLGGYGTQTGAVNNANQTSAGVANAASQNTGLLGNFINGAAQVASAYAKVADGGTFDQPTDAIVGERGPEAVYSGYQQPQQSMSMDQMVNGMAGQGTPPPQQPVANAGGYQNVLRGDGSHIPGNEPGGAQSRYGWQGHAANQMAGQAPGQPQVFTSPTRVTLGNNGADTVVPLNPGPNAKITPGQYRPQSMMAQQNPQQPAPRMPSRYRPATGPKGMVGPQQRPMQPMNQQYAA